MTSLDIIRTFFEFSAAVCVVLCFVFEKKLIAFENKVIAAIRNRKQKPH